MKPFCEVVVFEVLPAARALIARQLVSEHGVSQKRAAMLLGVSQPAVSQYIRDLRGYRTGLFRKNPGLRAMVDRVAEGMASGEIKGMLSTLSFCELCKEIRFSGAGCDLHRERDASRGQCTLCMDNAEFYGKQKTKEKDAKGKIKKLSRF